MRRVLVTFVVFGVVGATVTSSGALRKPTPPASHHHAAHELAQYQRGASPGVSRRLTLEADGATSPQAISDELAYAHFLRAMTAIKDPRGRDVALRAAGLDPADRAAFANALLPTVGALEFINGQRRTVTSDVLRATEQATLASARIRVQNALSIQGQAQFDAYIQTRVKRHVKMYRAQESPR